MLSRLLFIAPLEKRPGRMAILLAIFVLLAHIKGIIWLHQPISLPSDSKPPVPFKLEVTLLGNDSPPAKPAPPPATPQPQPKPESKPKAKKAPPPEAEKSPDLGEIDRHMKSGSAKELGQNVNYQPGQPTAQVVSAKMIVAPTGGAAAKDNFPPSVLHNPSPEYPEMAVFLGYQGTAMVRVKVAATGLSEGVHILRGSGFDLLDKATVTALKQWRFTPSISGNKAAPSSVVISVTYVLYPQDR